MSTTTIEAAYAQGSQPTGNFLKVVAAMGLNNYSPVPNGQVPIGIDQLYSDPFGNLEIRGQVLTDEESLRDDFEGTSLNTAVGNITLTNGSTSVTGTGFVNTYAVGQQHYIKVTADAASAWVLVAAVNSDTSLTLASAYTGTGGTGVPGQITRWPTTTVGSSTLAVATSILTIGTGTAASNQQTVWRTFDYLPMLFRARMAVSQRIANQQLRAGFASDNTTSPAMQALFLFNGTTNTTVITQTSWGPAGSPTTETNTITLPYSATTATALDYEIWVEMKQVTFVINGTIVAVHKLHVPDQYGSMNVLFDALNVAAAASTTTMTVDAVCLSNQDQLEVTNSIGQSIPVLFNEDVHVAYGLLTTTATTAGQVILSYTVPANRTLWILGYSISDSSTTINGSPIIVGKNTITEPASGATATDGTCFDGLFLNAATASQNMVSRTYSAPVKFAAGGDVVKIVVTPSGATSTTWRASLQFVLR